MNYSISLLFATALLVNAAQAQRIYLDSGLEHSSKSSAAYYLDPGGKDGSGGFVAKIYTSDGVLKADARYADAEYKIPNGHFTFYWPNGQEESSGDYLNGKKNGVWERHDKWGRELAEKVYDLSDLANLVYTMAETMPQYPGGEKALVRYLKDKVGKTRGDVMATFVVEKNGLLTGVNVFGAKDPGVADELVEVISNLPRWQAGVQDGQPVRVQMRVPLK